VLLGTPTHGWPLSRRLYGNIRELHRARRRGGCATGCAFDRTDDGRLPWTTDGAYGGWGGAGYHGTDGGRGGTDAGHRGNDTGPDSASPGADGTPVVFVHGNQRDACDWTDHAGFFLRRGYPGDGLWAITFREGTPTHGSMAAQLEDFVRRVLAHTGAGSVALVGHSLGVTGIRYWLATHDRYDSVETVVGLAGANHGTVLNAWCADAGLNRGVYRVSEFLRADYDRRRDHPLAGLNEEETPGDVDYYTLRGTEDPLFWRCRESPALSGATNVAIETGHDGVRVSQTALEYVYRWVADDHPYDLKQQVAAPG
jgi:pimeloyl-ACP methyl ester carboxylesterase